MVIYVLDIAYNTLWEIRIVIVYPYILNILRVNVNNILTNTKGNSIDTTVQYL